MSDFPVNSTAYETAAIKRVLRVLQRSKSRKYISHAGVFNCRRISGSTSWSQHAYGNGADLFPKLPAGDDAGDRQRIFHEVIRQATKRTIANRGRRIPVAEVIDHSGRVIWTPSQGVHPYGGDTGDHVHVSGAPLRSGTPACA